MALSIEEINKILLKDKENGEAWKIKGKLLADKMLFYEAGNCLSKSIACDPNYQDAWREKAFVCIMQNDMPDAYDCVLRALYLDKNDVEAWWLRSHLYPSYNKPELNKFNWAIDKALEINHQDIKTLITKGLHLRKQGLGTESLSYFEKVLSLDPKNIIALINKEKIIQKKKWNDTNKSIRIEKIKNFTINFLNETLGIKNEEIEKVGDKAYLEFDFETARSCYGKLIEVSPTNHCILKKLGLVNVKFQDYDEGLDFLKKSLQYNPKDTDCLTRIGQVFGIQNRVSEAIDYFDKALSIDENNSEALRHKCYALNLRHEGTESALTCLEESLKIDPYNPLAWIQKSIFLRRDPTNFEESMWCLDKVIEFHPSYEIAWKQKSEMYSNIEDFESAMKCNEKILKLNSEDTEIWYLAGVNQAKLAEKQFQQGEEFLKNKKYESAKDCFDMVLNIDPLDVETLIKQGDVSLKLNKKDKAKEFFKKAIRLDPNNKRIVSKINHLN